MTRSGIQVKRYTSIGINPLNWTSKNQQNDMAANITKEYTNGEITVVWKPNTCMHSEKCWRGLGSVFNPNERPWINIQGASTEDIIAQVEKCPSGALSWYRNEDGKPSQEEIIAATMVDIVPNGPIRIHGDVEITHSNGTSEKRERITALCRCGMSKNKPFCDGTHKRESWNEEA